MIHWVWQFFIIIAAIGLSACSTIPSANPHVFDSYTIGFGTPSGNDIWVKKVVFDDTWRTPVGSLSCCWERSGAASIIFRKPLPQKIYIEWIDQSDKLLYHGEISLTADIVAKAKQLPGYTVTSSGRNNKGDINLIVGMGEVGQIVVWLANAPYKKNVTGRFLYTAGKGQATSTPLNNNK